MNSVQRTPLHKRGEGGILQYGVTNLPAELYTNLYNTYMEVTARFQVRSIYFYIELPAGKLVTAFTVELLYIGHIGLAEGEGGSAPLWIIIIVAMLLTVCPTSDI